MNEEVILPPDAPTSPGALLRAAREAAGLSLDAVAQQLKLAPRQVNAIEEDDYGKLPGRTFVRGFIRNYARYLRMDGDALIALLPDADASMSLDRPGLGPGPRAMGELPAESQRKGSIGRWLIPLALLAVVVAAGVYEFTRPQSEARHWLNKTAPAREAPPADDPASPGTSSTPLRNPTEDAQGARDADKPAPENSSSAPPAIAPSSPSSEASSPIVPASMVNSAIAEPLLVLNFKGASWVEVKDRNGNILFSQTGHGGTTQGISGAVPLDVIIGKASEVAISFRGQPIDLTAYQRQNVARLSLK